jgi:hypothetical protein
MDIRAAAKGKENCHDEATETLIIKLQDAIDENGTGANNGSPASDNSPRCSTSMCSEISVNIWACQPMTTHLRRSSGHSPRRPSDRQLVTDSALPTASDQSRGI